MNKFLITVIAMTLISGCSPDGHSNDSALLQTTWNLIELNHSKTRHPDPQVPHLRFETEKVTGNDGCNNFFGSYTLDGSNLKFGMLASTRMACPQIEDFDMVFNKVLEMTTRYQISGNRLDLYADEEPLASFLAAEQS